MYWVSGLLQLAQSFNDVGSTPVSIDVVSAEYEEFRTVAGVFGAIEGTNDEILHCRLELSGLLPG